MAVDDFAAEAQQALARTNDPRRLAVLQNLAAVAADCPTTPGEIGYELILREVFLSLATGEPAMEPDDVAWCLILALGSLDRGGFVGAADACHDTLEFLSGLRGYEGLTVTGGSAGFVHELKPPPEG